MKPLHQALPGALIALLRPAPLSPGKVQFAWNMAVGPAVQRATSIKLDHTQLLVEVSSVTWAKEVMRSSSVILSRLQALLGDDVVSQVIVRPPPDSPAARRRRGSLEGSEP
jgi:hypothetical protein